MPLTLRCTAKLLHRMGLRQPLPEPGPSTTALGDWYGHLVYLRRRPTVLLVSERSLLPVLLPARDLPSLPFRFALALVEVLSRLGTPPVAVEDELAELAEMAFAKTRNRRVMGSITDFVNHLQGTVRRTPDSTLEDLQDSLLQMPCSPLDYLCPALVAPLLLAREFGRRQGVPESVIDEMLRHSFKLLGFDGPVPMVDGRGRRQGPAPLWEDRPAR
jgi:hypothetical protein